jgi:hypothetical protein
MARDAGAPAIALQVLVYPVVDLVRETGSHVRNAQGFMLTTAALRWFYDCYVPDRAMRADWRASPLLCPTLRGVTNSALDADIGCVLEIVIDGLTDAAVSAAMRAGLKAIIDMGPENGAKRIGAGNYGGKLGPFHYHLKDLLP